MAQHILVQTLTLGLHGTELNECDLEETQITNLVYQLLTQECFRTNILKLLNCTKIKSANTALKIEVSYKHELMLLSFLALISKAELKEVFLKGDDWLLSLCDYCLRIITTMCSSDIKILCLGQKALFILRDLTENLKECNLTVIARFTRKYDLPLIMLELIENSPFLSRKDDNWTKYIDEEWKEVEKDDLIILTTIEAQPWIILMQCMASDKFLESYEITDGRKSSLLRLKRYLIPKLLDQLPGLDVLKEFLLRLECFKRESFLRKEKLKPFFNLVEIVAQFEETIHVQLKEKEKLVKHLNQTHFNTNSKQADEAIHMLSEFYTSEAFQISFQEQDS